MVGDSKAKDKRPNFLIIVADDLGFSDIGCYGAEIQTPNIDKLAAEGLRFTDFHAAAMCSPTRSMLMTGTDCHIAGLGNLIEIVANNTMKHTHNSPLDSSRQRGMPGYEGYLNERVAALPELLKDAGYCTLMSGKWHLGLTPEHSPESRGFTHSFAHLQACANHFGWAPELSESEEAPRFIASTSWPLHLEGKKFVEQLPEDWYSTNGYTDIMLKYLKQRQDSGEDRKPFFAYLPFTAPHWPLQAPPEYVKKYHGVYDEGPDVLREKRLAALKKLGLAPPDVRPHPVVAEDAPEWSDMTPEQKAKSCRIMEVFAAMVDCIDVNVGRIMDYLASTDELDNTMICFMSDNGAAGAAYEASAFLRSTLLKHLEEHYDNSLDNLGNFNSFGWYGPRWASASSAPSRLFKAYTTEGGIRVPMVMRMPKHLQNPGIAENGIVKKFATVMDLMPTMLELAGVKHPAPSYQGREVVHMRGRTMLPFLNGENPSVHPVDFSEGWETSGRAGVRQGNWKAVWIPPPKGPGRWQLYDLDVDPGEIDDLSEQFPEKFQELLKQWDKYRDECGVIPLHPDQGKLLDLMEEQMTPNGWMEYEYWKKGAKPGEPTQKNFFNKPPRLQRPVA